MPDLLPDNLWRLNIRKRYKKKKTHVSDLRYQFLRGHSHPATKKQGLVTKLKELIPKHDLGVAL